MLVSGLCRRGKHPDCQIYPGCGCHCHKKKTPDFLKPVPYPDLGKPDDNPDFLTLLPCVKHNRQIVAVMKWDKVQDSYTIGKCSEPLSERAAAEKLTSWAHTLKLDVR